MSLFDKNRGVTVTPDAPLKPKRVHLGFTAANVQGLGTCLNQEDSFALSNVLDPERIDSRGLLAVVADGMGGMKDGKIASETAISVIRSEFERFDYSVSLSAQLKDAVIKANRAVYNELGGEGGSTLIACIFKDSHLFFAGVGDSYLILKRGNRIYHINRKHNLLNLQYLDMITVGNIHPEIARGASDKAALTQFLGMDVIRDIDIFRVPFKLLDGDVVLLCSDGVAGVLSDECIISCLSAPSPDVMCALLEKNVLALHRGYQDNYTALVVQCRA